MDSEGLRAILGRFTPKIGGRPPKEGVLPPKLGVDPQKLAPVCPQGPPVRPSMAAFQSVTGLNRGPFRGLCTRRPSKNPHLGRFFPVAVVEKFRSRIRILQFSTRKITPHGCVYVSSARPPIVIRIFCLILVCCGTNLGIAYLDFASAHPVTSTPSAGHSGTGVFCAKLCEKGALAGREPPPPNEGAVTPGPGCLSALFIRVSPKNLPLSAPLFPSLSAID